MHNETVIPNAGDRRALCYAGVNAFAEPIAKYRCLPVVQTDDTPGHDDDLRLAASIIGGRLDALAVMSEAAFDSSAMQCRRDGPRSRRKGLQCVHQRGAKLQGSLPIQESM